MVRLGDAPSRLESFFRSACASARAARVSSRMATSRSRSSRFSSVVNLSSFKVFSCCALKLESWSSSCCSFSGLRSRLALLEWLTSTMQERACPGLELGASSTVRESTAPRLVKSDCKACATFSKESACCIRPRSASPDSSEGAEGPAPACGGKGPASARTRDFQASERIASSSTFNLAGSCLQSSGMPLLFSGNSDLETELGLGGCGACAASCMVGKVGRMLPGDRTPDLMTARRSARAADSGLQHARRA